MIWVWLCHVSELSKLNGEGHFGTVPQNRSSSHDSPLYDYAILPVGYTDWLRLLAWWLAK